jgi:hypothetical protein
VITKETKRYIQVEWSAWVGVRVGPDRRKSRARWVEGSVWKGAISARVGRRVAPYEWRTTPGQVEGSARAGWTEGPLLVGGGSPGWVEGSAGVGGRLSPGVGRVVPDG